MSNFQIPYGRQQIEQDDIDAVVNVLQSNYLTQGPRIADFEQNFADYVGAKYAVAVANGTAALHLCAMALNVAPGQRVITSPITFAASANCIRYCGAEVVFADINRETYLLDIDQVRSMLESQPAGTYSGIIPVDFAGRAVDMEAYRQLADEHNLWIIEDACHAPGGSFTNAQGEQMHCGNGQYADLAIFSFHPVKHIAAGEGGMVTTNDEAMYQKLLASRTHGITRNTNIYQNDMSWAAAANNAEAYPGWYMEMQELGYNYRLSDIQAALGNAQLAKAEAGLGKRRAIIEKYQQAFSEVKGIVDHNPVEKPSKGAVSGHAYHLYVIEVEDRLGLYNYLRSQGIYTQIHYIPCHLMPYYRQFGWKEDDLPKAEDYYKHCISLPVFPALTKEEQDFVIKHVIDFVAKSD